MAVSELNILDKPQTADLDKCVHCGLCLGACPTYRELGLEADSPRGRIYQMVQVSTGAAKIDDSYMEHIDLCLACRGCETACPSGVQYGKLVEAARAEIETHVAETGGRSWWVGALRDLVFRRLLPSRAALVAVGRAMWLYQATGVRSLVRASGVLKLMGKMGAVESLSPDMETPFFFNEYGKVLPAEGARKYRVAFLGGCIANLSFARMHEATVRVLRKNGCEVSIPGDQTCCGALAVHAGVRDQTRKQAKINIDALLAGGYDAIVTNAAGCGSTLKEYGELFDHDPDYHAKAVKFSALVKDITEFLTSMELNPNMGRLDLAVTYQDSCHLAHGQKIKAAPRMLLKSIPGLEYREMPMADLCCGSAGIYNLIHTDLAMSLLEKKMGDANGTKAPVIATANPGCMLQLRAGAAKFGQGQRVAHVVELLDEAYRNYKA